MRKGMFLILLLASMLISVAACATDSSEYVNGDVGIGEDNAPNDSEIEIVSVPGDSEGDETECTPCEVEPPPYEPPPCACYELCEYERQNLRVWTIAELGEIIVASVTFWTEVWEWSGRFDQYHFGRAPPELRHGPYTELLPTSGFESKNDILEYLLQFYTVAWLDAFWACEWPPFIEYDNMLLMFDARTCSERFEISEYSLALAVQDGCRAVVVAYVYGERTWTYADNYTDYFHFVFTNGRVTYKSFPAGGWGFRFVNVQ